MQRLEIGENIYRLRKEKKITQEELSKVLQVSVSAISKWESGVSYPDITLLPSIANFFDSSIDEIMSHKGSYDNLDVNRIIENCSDEYEANGFEKGLEACIKYSRKYVKAYRLKIALASIININAAKLTDKEKKDRCYANILSIYNDIINNSNDKDLIHASIIGAGTIYIYFEEYDKAISLYNKINSSKININSYIVQAYMKKGNSEEAKKISQENLIYDILNVNLNLNNLIELFKKDDEELALKYLELSKEFSKLLELENDNSYYMNLASIKIANKKNEEAILAIKKLLEVELIKKEDKPWYINGLKEKEDSKTGEKILGMLNTKSLLIKSLMEDEKFSELHEDEAFLSLVKQK